MLIPQVLTNDQLINLAPAIGATRPFEEVSDKYDFVPTIEVVDLLRGEGWFPINATQAGVRKKEKDGFQKHSIRFWREGTEISNGERVDLFLYNSHDRSAVFNLLASIWRQVCSNGLMVSSRLSEFSHKHINFDHDAFISSADQIAKNAGMIAERVGEFKSIELKPSERSIFAESAQVLRHADDESGNTTASYTADKLLKTHRYDDKGNDLWTTYNVIQENLMKGGIVGRSKNGMRTKTRGIKAVGTTVSLNKALWKLTEKMAMLKEAA